MNGKCCDCGHDLIFSKTIRRNGRVHRHPTGVYAWCPVCRGKRK